MKLILVTFNEGTRIPVTLLRYSDTAKWSDQLKNRICNMLIKGVTKFRQGRIINISTLAGAVATHEQIPFVRVSRTWRGLECTYVGFPKDDIILTDLKGKVIADIVPLLRMQLGHITGIKDSEYMERTINQVISSVNERKFVEEYILGSSDTQKNIRNIIHDTLYTIFLKHVKPLAMRRAQWKYIVANLDNSQEMK